MENLFEKWTRLSGILTEAALGSNDMGVLTEYQAGLTIVEELKSARIPGFLGAHVIATTKVGSKETGVQKSGNNTYRDQAMIKARITQIQNKNADNFEAVKQEGINHGLATINQMTRFPLDGDSDGTLNWLSGKYVIVTVVGEGTGSIGATLIAQEDVKIWICDSRKQLPQQGLDRQYITSNKSGSSAPGMVNKSPGSLGILSMDELRGIFLNDETAAEIAAEMWTEFKANAAPAIQKQCLKNIVANYDVRQGLRNKTSFTDAEAEELIMKTLKDGFVDGLEYIRKGKLNLSSISTTIVGKRASVELAEFFNGKTSSEIFDILIAGNGQSSLLQTLYPAAWNSLPPRSTRAQAAAHFYQEITGQHATYVAVQGKSAEPVSMAGEVHRGLVKVFEMIAKGIGVSLTASPLETGNAVKILANGSEILKLTIRKKTSANMIPAGGDALIKPYHTDVETINSEVPEGAGSNIVDGNGEIGAWNQFSGDMPAAVEWFFTEAKPSENLLGALTGVVDRKAKESDAKFAARQMASAREQFGPDVDPVKRRKVLEALKGVSMNNPRDVAIIKTFLHDIFQTDVLTEEEKTQFISYVDSYEANYIQADSFRRAGSLLEALSAGFDPVEESTQEKIDQMAETPSGLMTLVDMLKDVLGVQ